MWRYTIYVYDIYSTYYTATRGGKFEYYMWERPARRAVQTTHYNDNIVWPFGPCTIIQLLFSLPYSNGWAAEDERAIVFPPYYIYTRRRLHRTHIIVIIII